MDEKKDVKVPEEIDTEKLDEVSGGTMRGNVVIRDTTDISQDTKKNI